MEQDYELMLKRFIELIDTNKITINKGSFTVNNSKVKLPQSNNSTIRSTSTITR